MSSSNSASQLTPKETPKPKGREYWKLSFFTQCQGLTGVENPRCPDRQTVEECILQSPGGLWETWPETRNKDFNELRLQDVFIEEYHKMLDARKKAKNPASRQEENGSLTDPSEDSNGRDSEETVRPEEVWAILDGIDGDKPHWFQVGIGMMKK
ncbi:hypothetical protein NHQ30_000465 [Ciborinia camelliae]|nr:hypothetical protein NHQ30_000465 [Ciborinia camelliae]